MSKKNQDQAKQISADPKPVEDAKPAADEGKAQAGEQAQQPEGETQAGEQAQPVLFRIEQARNLPELDKDVKAEPAGFDKITFQAFKATDGRTMRVVELDGTLYAQEA